MNFVLNFISKTYLIFFPCLVLCKCNHLDYWFYIKQTLVSVINGYLVKHWTYLDHRHDRISLYKSFRWLYKIRLVNHLLIINMYKCLNYYVTWGVNTEISLLHTIMLRCRYLLSGDKLHYTLWVIRLERITNYYFYPRI